MLDLINYKIIFTEQLRWTNQVLSTIENSENQKVLSAKDLLTRRVLGLQKDLQIFLRKLDIIKKKYEYFYNVPEEELKIITGIGNEIKDFRYNRVKTLLFSYGIT